MISRLNEAFPPSSTPKLQSLTIPLRSCLRKVTKKLKSIALQKSETPTSLPTTITSLPPELRHQIFTLAMQQGPATVHIIPNIQPGSPTIQTNYKCHSDGKKREANCWLCSRWEDCIVRREPIIDDLLALPKTCRSFYHDTINLVYSSRILHIEGIREFIQFANAIPRQRLDYIRRLHMIWPWPWKNCWSVTNLEDLYPQWRSACETLSHMRGLRELIIYVKGPATTSDVGMRILEAFMIIQHVRDFQLQIDWNGRYPANAPFHLIKRNYEWFYEDSMSIEPGCMFSIFLS